MISIQGLTRRFGSAIAVDNVTIEVPAGQIVGYLGPNGAGKTTTVNMLTGQLAPSTGRAVVAGCDVASQPVEVKTKIGVVPESGVVYESLTAYEYLRFVAQIHGLDDDVIYNRIGEYARLFQISDALHEPMTGYSKGMKQKVVISAALIHDPEVIFLDEPLNGLDANAALLLKRLIMNLAQSGKTIFYCSHILDVVENICERVVILHQGRVVADDSVAALKEMTRNHRLEDVFTALTQSEDPGEVADAFTRKLQAGNH